MLDKTPWRQASLLQLVLLMVLMVLGSAAPPVWAQDDAERAARRQRQLMQRAQADLEDANAQRDTLLTQKTAAESSAKKAQAQLQSQNQNQNKLLTAAKATAAEQLSLIERLQADLALLRETSARQLAEAQGRETALRSDLAAARRDVAQRLQTVQALVALLENSTTTGRQAENKNAALYRDGLAAVERYRQEAGTAEISVLDPLGLRAVKRENTVDGLRESLGRNAPPK